MSVVEIADEETPLLQGNTPTPLPWSQFSLVLVLQLAEPLTSNVIYPFAPQVCPTMLNPRLLHEFFAAHSRHWHNPWKWKPSRILRWNHGRCWNLDIRIRLYFEWILFSNRSSFWCKRSQSYTGAEYQIVSVENRLFSLAYLVYRFRCTVLDCRKPFGHLSSGEPLYVMWNLSPDCLAQSKLEWRVE